MLKSRSLRQILVLAGFFAFAGGFVWYAQVARNRAIAEYEERHRIDLPVYQGAPLAKVDSIIWTLFECPGQCLAFNTIEGDLYHYSFSDGSLVRAGTVSQFARLIHYDDRGPIYENSDRVCRGMLDTNPELLFRSTDTLASTSVAGGRLFPAYLNRTGPLNEVTLSDGKKTTLLNQAIPLRYAAGTAPGQPLLLALEGGRFARYDYAAKTLQYAEDAAGQIDASALYCGDENYAVAVGYATELKVFSRRTGRVTFHPSPYDGRRAASRARVFAGRLFLACEAPLATRNVVVTVDLETGTRTDVLLYPGAITDMVVTRGSPKVLYFTTGGELHRCPLP
jgi:hypothetical protein